MNDELKIIIDKYLDGKASDRERERVDTWYQSFDVNPGLTDQLGPDETAKAMTRSFAALFGKLALPAKDLNRKVF